MSKVPRSFRFGKKFDGDAGDLQNQIAKNYDDLARAVNRKPHIVVTDRNPEVADRGFDIGTMWFKYSGPNLWILSSNNPVTWTVIL